FQTTYGSRAQTALPYAMNSEFSSTLMAQMVRRLRASLTSSLLQSVSFKTTSRNLARAMCMKNLKLTVIVVVVSLVVLYVVVSAACGGLSWPNCIRK
uniref:V-SNARE coiled-coil homology domain-containing protein n=1 Tax=Hucho hucho TaxID=62062 RepID=A0A4W5JXU8_9TELE